MRIMIITLALLITGCGGDLGEGKHYIPVTVMELGRCSEHDGPYECAIKAKYPSGKIQYMKVYGDVLVGQTVYKHCWVESDGDYCFTSARLHIKSRYNRLRHQI